MQIVIEIDDDIARGIIEGNNNVPRNIVRNFQATIADAIKNGTPLPKEYESRNINNYITLDKYMSEDLKERIEYYENKDIKALPPVTSVRKKGKPIYDIDSQDWEFNRPFKCPFCNERLDYNNHYCHNCGAEMED